MNKILHDYLDNKIELEKNSNYNQICLKIEKRNNIKKQIMNISIVCIAFIFVGIMGSTIYAKRVWDIEYKEFENRSRFNTTTKLQDLEQEYSYQDGIGVKINSVLKRPGDIYINVGLKLDDYFNINTDTLSFGYAIFDENNNIYDASGRFKYGAGIYYNYSKKLARELGLKYSQRKALPEILSGGGSLPKIISSKDGEMVFDIYNYTYKGYPESEKLFIRIFDIGFAMQEWGYNKKGSLKIKDAEDFQVSDCEWQFEIDIPEEFRKYDCINLKMKNEVEGFELEKAELSDSGLICRMKHNCKGIKDIKLIDEKGNEYGMAGMADKKIFAMKFDVKKEDLDKRLFIIIKDEGKGVYEKIELIQK